MGGERLVTTFFCKIEKDVTQKSFCKGKKKKLFLLVIFPPENIRNKMIPLNAYSESLWGHPKNYMLCQHIGFQCPLKLEMEKI